MRRSNQPLFILLTGGLSLYLLMPSSKPAPTPPTPSAQVHDTGYRRANHVSAPYTAPTTKPVVLSDDLIKAGFSTGTLPFVAASEIPETGIVPVTTRIQAKGPVRDGKPGKKSKPVAEETDDNEPAQQCDKKGRCWSSEFEAPMVTDTPAKPADKIIAFANCTEARAAGYINIKRGAPGYAPHLDRDDDGIGCETKGGKRR